MLSLRSSLRPVAPRSSAPRAPAATRVARRARAPPATRLAAGKDFDAVLAEWAEKFEAMPSDKKIPIVGWSAAAVSALFIVEKIVHTVGLDVLLGFPIQLVGILALPGLVARYVLDGKDALEDAGAYVNDIAKRLPGLK